MPFDPDDLVPDGDSDDPAGGKTSIAALALVANAAYSPSTSPFGSGTLVAPQPITTTDPNGNTIQLLPVSARIDPTGTQEMVAYKTADGSQIVFGVEGTWNLTNVFTDIATFGSGSPSSQFLDYLKGAAQFISDVEKANPGAQFSISGHSLGGAEAQILGYYLNLPATAFNAPGVGGIVNSQQISSLLQSFMPAGYDPTTSPNVVNENISVEGDLVHRIGPSFGTQGTIISSNPNSAVNTNDSWFSAWTDHSLDTEIKQLNEITTPNSGTTIQEGTFENDSFLQQGFILAGSTLDGPDTSSYNYTIAAGEFSIVDPPSGSQLLYTPGAGSVSLANLYLPGDGQAIAKFEVWTEVANVWSAAHAFAAGTPIQMPAGLQAVRIEALGAKGNALTLPSGYSFFDTFTAAGAVTGALSSFLPGNGRFEGHTRSDILIENSQGAVVLGEGNGANQMVYSQVAALGPEWSFRGSGDLLNNGKTQFLIENASGAVVVGQVANGLTSYTTIAALGTEWHFRGTGDFLAKGDDQFLIENASGAVVVGDAGANGQVAYSQVAALGAEWKFVGDGNFLGHGTTDFLIENSSGSVVVGEVVNGHAAYSQVAALGPEWVFRGAGDFLGDGASDFLIENASGAVVVGEVTNGQTKYTQVAALGPEWVFKGAGDYLGEGHDQFLIENATGAVVIGDWSGGHMHFTQVGALGSEWVFH